MSQFTCEYYKDSEEKDVRTSRLGLHNSSWWNDGPTHVSPQQHTSRFRSELYGEPKHGYTSWHQDREAASELYQEIIRWEQERLRSEKKGLNSQNMHERLKLCCINVKPS